MQMQKRHIAWACRRNSWNQMLCLYGIHSGCSLTFPLNCFWQHTCHDRRWACIVYWMITQWCNLHEPSSHKADRQMTYQQTAFAYQWRIGSQHRWNAWPSWWRAHTCCEGQRRSALPCLAPDPAPAPPWGLAHLSWSLRNQNPCSWYRHKWHIDMTVWYISTRCISYVTHIHTWHYTEHLWPGNLYTTLAVANPRSNLRLNIKFGVQPQTWGGCSLAPEGIHC